MTYDISRLVQVMPTARLNREMMANVLFRHQLRNMSFKDTDFMDLFVFYLSKAIRFRGMWQVKPVETIRVNRICLIIGQYQLFDSSGRKHFPAYI